MNRLRILEAKMNLLANFYNRERRFVDHISITRKDRKTLNDQEGEVMGLVKVGKGYEFRGYKLEVTEDL